MTFTPWLNRAGPAVLERGVTRERAEQSADESYDRSVKAPPCPACGKDVQDKDWLRHRFEDHGLTESIRPYGVADSRELLVVGADTDELARKVARWRWTHPGLRLLLAADGRVDGGLLFVRYRLTDRMGMPVR